MISNFSKYLTTNDIAASHRYYNADIIKPEVELDGTFINVSEEKGLGYKVDFENLAKFTVEQKELV
ncbi:hypothetical protein [Liquorilactobacillus mali]|uniref:Enolase C-terminal domain-containing protein n=1 Tax=Liquorilactobacillus mali KCTC 3596 = DSM 20444 TaxID=1046596 RepID=J1F0P0_9LACO|nr:hypothetical protein [Liquorilactobacillus mali]EJE97539.1 N-acylamino acid racemase [Liquorilactobacillus mali KCTC 3596 = DSM 20444]KRN11217.1 hypothetical protein FD00_GL001219 [Liquorilactobacillus mali KCTC 3596 = DSM 20444]QFQ73791.1 N-acylamino acid racemase [Liquorilactobacillus mali]